MNLAVLTIECEDPAQGTLSVNRTVDLSELGTYNGPLGRIIINTPGLPESHFMMPAKDFIILLAQFIATFRGVQ